MPGLLADPWLPPAPSSVLLLLRKSPPTVIFCSVFLSRGAFCVYSASSHSSPCLWGTDMALGSPSAARGLEVLDSALLFPEELFIRVPVPPGRSWLAGAWAWGEGLPGASRALLGRPRGAPAAPHLGKDSSPQGSPSRSGGRDGQVPAAVPRSPALHPQQLFQGLPCPGPQQTVVLGGRSIPPIPAWTWYSGCGGTVPG